LSVIIPAIAGWSIPAIAGWMNGKRQRGHLRQYMTRIDEVNKNSNSQDSVEFSRQFDQIRTDIENSLGEGNISESHYEILNSKISEYLKTKE